MSRVTLYTPIDENLAAGIVCFGVDSLEPSQVALTRCQHQIQTIGVNSTFLAVIFSSSLSITLERASCGSYL